MLIDEVKFNAAGLVPAIIQDEQNNEVLMIGYMNAEALKKSLETGKVHFWSRSRQKIWMKGETSGHFQEIKEIAIDCDGDALLFKVEQIKAACHTGYRSCFYRRAQRMEDSWAIDGEKVFKPDIVYNKAYSDKTAILKELYDVIVDRRTNPKEGSYTCYLFDKGIDKMLKKIGEESAEVIIAAKNGVKSEVIYETSDLIYHLLVVLIQQGVSLDEIYDELRRRR